MNWIHCNNCFNLQSHNNENYPFFMTSCGHIFCGRCTDGSMTKCLLLKNDCSYTLLSIVQRDHEVLFTNPSLSLQKNMRTIDFQLSQYTSLINYLKDKFLKYNAQKQEITTLKSECKRHRDEKNNLKNDLIQKHEEVRHLKKQIENYQNQRNFFLEKNSGTQNSGQSGSGYLFGNSAPENSQLSFSPMVHHSGSHVFTPPKPVAFSKTYRDTGNYQLSTPQRKTPAPLTSPPSSEYTPRATLRRVMLPGDKGSSPINRIGLQRLNLKCTPSCDRVSQSNMLRVPSRVQRPAGPCQSASKYNKYF